MLFSFLPISTTTRDASVGCLHPIDCKERNRHVLWKKSISDLCSSVSWISECMACDVPLRPSELWLQQFVFQSYLSSSQNGACSTVHLIVIEPHNSVQFNSIQLGPSNSPTLCCQIESYQLSYLSIVLGPLSQYIYIYWNVIPQRSERNPYIYSVLHFLLPPMLLIT